MARKDHYYLYTALPVGLRSAPSFLISFPYPPPPLPVRPAHKFTLIPFVTHLCNTGSYGTIMFIWQHLTTFTLSLAVSWTFWLCQSFTKVWGVSSSPMGMEEGLPPDHPPQFSIASKYTKLQPFKSTKCWLLYVMGCIYPFILWLLKKQWIYLQWQFRPSVPPC